LVVMPMSTVAISVPSFTIFIFFPHIALIAWPPSWIACLNKELLQGGYISLISHLVQP
jgi:hypothetical protein